MRIDELLQLLHVYQRRHEPGGSGQALWILLNSSSKEAPSADELRHAGETWVRNPGPAQATGRYGTTVESKLRLRSTLHHTILLCCWDLKILLETVRVVLQRETSCWFGKYG